MDKGVKNFILKILDFLYMISFLGIAISVLMFIVFGLQYGFVNYKINRLVIVIGIPILTIFLIKYIRKKIEDSKDDTMDNESE